MRIVTVAGLVLMAIVNSAIAQTADNAVPHVIVYKTKADYRKLVPVTMSANKTEIVSYPDPKDIKTGSGYPLPVLLHKGYLLDKRGIGKNTVFLNITYEAYARLKHAPDPKAMLRMIKNKHPFTTMYDCGSRYTRSNGIVKELNELIDNKKIGENCILMN